MKKQNKYTIKSKKNIHNKTNKIYAGKVIGSGGYGCVFHPALKCIDNNYIINKNNYVSKLMLKDDAIDEYNNINIYKKYITNIKNYKKYFIVDNITICNPDIISEEDTISSNIKCNFKDINNNLDKYKILNIPYSGIDLDDYFFKLKNYSEMKILNKKLIELLNNAIIKMNNIGIYHTDIKDNNILVEYNNKNNIKVRLIDWGLAVKNNNLTRAFNSNIRMNAPYSIILFNYKFRDSYDNFLNSFENNISYGDIIYFMREYFNKIIKEMRQYKSIVNIYKLLNINDKIVDDTIINYLSEVLYKYTINKKFNINKFLVDVFLKNIDVYGFLILYVMVLRYLNKINKNQYENMLYDKIKEIYIKYAINTPTEAINIKELNKDLYSLNDIFSILYKNNIHIEKI